MEFTPAKHLEALNNGELKQKCAYIGKYGYKALSENTFWTSNREYSSHNCSKEKSTKTLQDYFIHVRKNSYCLVILYYKCTLISSADRMGKGRVE